MRKPSVVVEPRCQASEFTLNEKVIPNAVGESGLRGRVNGSLTLRCGHGRLTSYAGPRVRAGVLGRVRPRALGAVRARSRGKVTESIRSPRVTTLVSPLAVPDAKNVQSTMPFST